MVRELSPELAKLAKAELNEDPKRIPQDLQHLKEWLSKQPHLKARTDDQWLLAILRGCKFSLEKVKTKIDLYYTLRTIAPDITLRLKPSQPKFLEVLKIGTCVILPKADNPLSSRYILIRPGAYDTDKYHVNDLMCVLYYLVQILVLEDETPSIVGTKIIVDYKGVTTNHVMQASPVSLKKMVAVAQDSMPLRLKGSHHLNVPSGVEFVFGIVKGFIKEKAKQRLRIEKNQEDLIKTIPKEIVPAEYGGTGGTIDEITNYWAQKVTEYRSWMEYEETLGTDESKRPGRPQTAEDMFGIQGSFRTLDID